MLVLPVGGVTLTAMLEPGSNTMLSNANKTLVPDAGTMVETRVTPFVTVEASAPFSVVDVSVLALLKFRLYGVIAVPAEMRVPVVGLAITSASQPPLPPVDTSAL